MKVLLIQPPLDCTENLQELKALGVESGSEAMLSQIDKKTDLKKIRRGTALVRKYGLLIHCYIIASLPDETSEDRQDSIDLIEECKPHFVTVSLLKLSPSTELYRRYCKENNKYDSNGLTTKGSGFPTTKGKSG